MKYFKRTNMYKLSNVTFNPENNESLSYDWWCFTKMIGGKLVFNNYNYSPSTIKHQYKVRALLHDLGIKIDLEVAVPKGLQWHDSSKDVSDHYASLIKDIETLIAKPRSQARKNIERKIEIAQLILERDTFLELNDSTDLKVVV